jgi:ferredoxin
VSDILRWEHRTTRKPHRCFGCGKEYSPGTKMVSAAYADGGTVDSCYWCSTCQEYMRRYFKYGDETGYGEIYANDREGWNKLDQELNDRQIEI